MDAPDDNIYNPQSQLSRRAFIVGSLAAGFALAVLPVTDLPEGIHGQTTLFYDRRPIVKIAESIYATRSDHRVRTPHATNSDIMPTLGIMPRILTVTL